MLYIKQGNYLFSNNNILALTFMYAIFENAF